MAPHPALSLEGEGWGEGEHTALVVIPFTLCDRGIAESPQLF